MRHLGGARANLGDVRVLPDIETDEDTIRQTIQGSRKMNQVLDDDEVLLTQWLQARNHA